MRSYWQVPLGIHGLHCRSVSIIGAKRFAAKKALFCDENKLKSDVFVINRVTKNIYATRNDSLQINKHCPTVTQKGLFENRASDRASLFAVKPVTNTPEQERR